MYYVYKCDKCDKEVTIERSIYSRDDKVICIHCGKDMKRSFTAPSIMTGEGYKQ